MTYCASLRDVWAGVILAMGFVMESKLVVFKDKAIQRMKQQEKVATPKNYLVEPEGRKRLAAKKSRSSKG